MKRDGFDSVGAEPLDQSVRSVLGTHEHERELPLTPQLADQGLDAVLVLDRHKMMLDVGAGTTHRRTVFVDHGVPRVSRCQPSGVAVQRR